MAELKGDLIRLSKQQIGQACAMLTRAFSDDPKLTYLIPDIAAKKDLSLCLFEFELQYGMNYGDVYTTSPAVEGVAVWLPSAKSEITFWRSFSVRRYETPEKPGENGYGSPYVFFCRQSIIFIKNMLRFPITTCFSSVLILYTRKSGWQAG